MAVKERQYYILRGTVQRQKLEEDIERILGLYQDHGFVQMRVERYDTAVDRDKARVTITIDVVEGAQYRVGTIKFSGVTLVPEEEVRRQLGFKSGDVFSRSALRDGVRNITDLYSTIGRASADVIPAHRSAAGDPTVDVSLEIDRGARGLRRAHQHHAATRAARTASCAARFRSWRATSSRCRSCSGPASGWSTWATSTW